MEDAIDFKITYRVVCRLLEELDRLPNIPPHLRALRAELDCARFDFTRTEREASQ